MIGDARNQTSFKTMFDTTPHIELGVCVCVRSWVIMCVRKIIAYEKYQRDTGLQRIANVEKKLIE